MGWISGGRGGKAPGKNKKLSLEPVRIIGVVGRTPGRISLPINSPHMHNECMGAIHIRAQRIRSITIRPHLWIPRMHNPYSPPSTKIENVEVAKGSPIKAVVVALLVDIGGSILAGGLLTAIYAFDLVNSGTQEDELMEAISNLPPDSWVYIVGIAIGCLFSVLGGYLCARIAKRSEYKFGHVVSGISVTFGLIVGIETYSPLMNFALALATWASVMAGVHLGVSRNRAI